MRIFFYCLLVFMIVEAILALYRTNRAKIRKKGTLDYITRTIADNRAPRIFILCADHDRPSGGVKQLYRHVDILNRNGFSASILHKQKGFRSSWFDNETRISYSRETNISPSDYLVIPENEGPGFAEMVRGIKTVIFNQNAYSTFQRYSFNKDDLLSPYLSKDIIATLVVSEDNERYLKHVFPEMKSYRIFNAIDPSIFNYSAAKKRQIAFMPRKHPEDALRVINILKFRGQLSEYDIVPIDNKSELETANILKESMIYLGFGYPEGWGMSAAEAMACGCIVIGYDGMGGKEYFKPEFSYPIPQGDILLFAQTVEKIIDLQKSKPEMLNEKAKTAANFIYNHYSLERESHSIVSSWKEIIKNTPK